MADDSANRGWGGKIGRQVLPKVAFAGVGQAAQWIQWEERQDVAANAFLQGGPFKHARPPLVPNEAGAAEARHGQDCAGQSRPR